jgi:hypothetical protein
MKQLLYISFFLFPILSFGQKIAVSGKVTDKKTGEPIYYATVLVDKMGIETRTDFDGKYSLKVSLNDTLIFRYVGMKSQKVKAEKEEINIQLNEEEQIIEEFGPPIRPIKPSNHSVTKVTQEEIQQEKKIVGKIFEKETNLIVLGALIKNKTTGTSAFSDYDGKFEIAASVNDIIEIHYFGLLADIEIKITDQSYYEIFLGEYIPKKTKKQIRLENRELKRKGFIKYED